MGLDCTPVVVKTCRVGWGRRRYVVLLHDGRHEGHGWCSRLPVLLEHIEEADTLGDDLEGLQYHLVDGVVDGVSDDDVPEAVVSKCTLCGRPRVFSVMDVD